MSGHHQWFCALLTTTVNTTGGNTFFSVVGEVVGWGEGRVEDVLKGGGPSRNRLRREAVGRGS